MTTSEAIDLLTELVAGYEVHVNDRAGPDEAAKCDATIAAAHALIDTLWSGQARLVEASVSPEE